MDLQSSFGTDGGPRAGALYADSVESTQGVCIDGLTDVPNLDTRQSAKTQKAAKLAVCCVYQLPFAAELVSSLQAELATWDQG